MSHQATLEQVEKLARQLEPQESLQLIAHITERLRNALPIAIDRKRDKERMHLARLQLANELLAEVDGLEDDSQGQSDAAEMIRRLRDERMTQICQKDA
ncbi:MAG: hypothetical protein ACRENG_01490 [bacterium]